MSLQKSLLPTRYSRLDVCFALSSRSSRQGPGLLVCEAKAMVQVWDYTQTPSGNWAEITRFNEKGVGYVRRDGLETAFD